MCVTVADDGSLSLQEDGFLELYQLGGHAHLKQLPCLYSAMACVCHAHLQHRASTYEKLLAGSLKARARLLTLLQKKKDPSVLRHCKQLSALLANSGLKTTPQLRQMQMAVCTEEGSRQLGRPCIVHCLSISFYQEYIR